MNMPRQVVQSVSVASEPIRGPSRLRQPVLSAVLPAGPDDGTSPDIILLAEALAELAASLFIAGHRPATSCADTNSQEVKRRHRSTVPLVCFGLLPLLASFACAHTSIAENAALLDASARRASVGRTGCLGSELTISNLTYRPGDLGGTPAEQEWMAGCNGKTFLCHWTSYPFTQQADDIACHERQP